MLDPLIEIAKHAPTSKSKSDWYQEIFKRSEMQRSVGESREVAFARYITKSEEGRVLFNAHYYAPGSDWQPPVSIAKAEVPHQTEAMSRLEA